MSTFGGKLKEFEYISIDRFDKLNLRSSVYFLSHCHRDHMEGLASNEFFNRLKKLGLKLYCHSITATLLLAERDCERLKPFIETLEVHECRLVSCKYPLVDWNHTNQLNQDIHLKEYSFAVTALPAQHCLGSVMFLFEGDDGRVLYTGDIRLIEEDLVKMPALHIGEGWGRTKPIDSLYIDTTFCKRSCALFPSRQESVRLLVEQVYRWLKKDNMNKVFVYIPSNYGHEYLLQKLSEELDTNIHVTEKKKEIFSTIEQLKHCVTADPMYTRIHACAYWDDWTTDKSTRPTKFNTCSYCKVGDPHVLVIKVSAMHFVRKHINSGYVEKVNDRTLRLFYSTHSSMQEISQVIRYLKPKGTFANVIPPGSSAAQVRRNLDEIMVAAGLLDNMPPEPTCPQASPVTELLQVGKYCGWMMAPALQRPDSPPLFSWYGNNRHSSKLDSVTSTTGCPFAFNRSTGMEGTLSERVARNEEALIAEVDQEPLDDESLVESERSGSVDLFGDEDVAVAEHESSNVLSVAVELVEARGYFEAQSSVPLGSQNSTKSIIIIEQELKQREEVDLTDYCEGVMDGAVASVFTCVKKSTPTVGSNTTSRSPLDDDSNPFPCNNHTRSPSKSQRRREGENRKRIVVVARESIKLVPGKPTSWITKYGIVRSPIADEQAPKNNGLVVKKRRSEVI